MEIKVDDPMDCPLNSECQCRLYSEIEGATANKCPSGGSYPNYEFPVNCPLVKEPCTIKRGR